LKKKNCRKECQKHSRRGVELQGLGFTAHTFLNSTFLMQVVGTKTLSPSEDDGDNTSSDEKQA
jgi:hypothetical protein